MSGYTAKRAVSRRGVAQRESGPVLRDTSNHEDRNVQSCNRLGCSTRLNCMKSSQVGTSDRTKYSRPSFRSTSGKLSMGSSSKTYSAVGNNKKRHEEPQTPSSHKEAVSSEISNIQVQTEVSEPIPLGARILTELPEAEDAKSGVLKDFSVGTSEEVDGCTAIINRKAQLKIHERSGPGNTSFGYPKRSSASRDVSQTAKSTSHRGGLKNLGCSSISDVLPSGCSSSHLSHSRRAEVVKKRSDGDCSSSGKIMSESSIGRSSSTQNSLSSPSALSEHSSAPQASKRTRKQPLSREDVTSVRTQTTNGDNRARTYRHGKGNRTSLPEPLNVLPRVHQTELSLSGSTPSISSQQKSYCRPGGSNETVRNRLTDHIGDSTARPLHGLSIDPDGFRRFNTDGIAEVLSALERIEQDEGLTYEQILVLESNLFVDGFSFLDQHRDMRLDIDNMSYEELLDLEEKMGTVSTALPEETLSNCVRRSCYMPAHSDIRSKSCVDDDAKCSICQEEYTEGDEVGKLGCDHGYHMACVHQWLRQKNWCPICKAPAASS